MSMQIVRGMTSNNYKKRKVNKKSGYAKVVRDHEAFLKKMGVSDKPSNYRADMPDLSVRKSVDTSDVICNNGIKKTNQTYTGNEIAAAISLPGNEIAGIVTTHKSNLMPVRKDNKQGIIDAANMRR